MSFPEVADTFTLASHPPRGGRYILFRPSDPSGGPSQYDCVQFFAFTEPPLGWDVDPFFDGRVGWTLASSVMVDVFMDDRQNLPVFTIVEKRGKFCRVEQVGGDRVVDGLKSKWISTLSISNAVSHGILVMLS